MSLLKDNGRLILMEGSEQGHLEMNNLKIGFGLPINKIKWHNKFIDDEKLIGFMKSYRLIDKGGIGGYILLTRCIRPYFDHQLNWDCYFNDAAKDLNGQIGLDKFSRIKLCVYEKTNNNSSGQ